MELNLNTDLVSQLSELSLDNEAILETLVSELSKLDLSGLSTEEILQTIYAFATSLTIAGSPGSDSFQTGAVGIDFLLAREGNDVLLTVDDSLEFPGQRDFDVLDGGPDKDRFLLGNRRTVFYNDGNPSSSGEFSKAMVMNFDPAIDVIQLHGSAANYVLQVQGQTTNIFLLATNGAENELIGSVLGVTGLTLTSPNFKYVSGEAAAPIATSIKQYGNIGQNIPWNISIADDDSGELYVTGTTVGNLGGTSAGSLDGYLFNYSSTGIKNWSKQIGTSTTDNIFGANTDSLGNVFFVGRTKGDLAAPNAGIGNDIVFGKYDSEGNSLWTKQFGSFGLDNSFVSPKIDAQGNVFLAGYTDGSLFGPNASTSLFSPLDPWVAKYDANGNNLWGKQFGSDQADELFGMDLDPQGNVLMTGWTVGDLAAPNNVDPNGEATYDIWLQKTDTNGNILWSDQIGSNENDWAWDIKANAASEVYVTGWTLGDLAGTGNAGSYDYYIAKYSSTGDQLWIKQYGTAGDDAATRMALDGDGNLYLTGYTNAAPSGDIIGTGGGYDAWVAKFTPEGNEVWRKTIGTPELENGFGIAVQDDRLYVSGHTEGSLGATNQGSYDGWVALLDTTSGSVVSFNPLG